MFTLIDNWLLDRVFQKFADWFRDTYGRTTFWIASLCGLSYLGFYLADKFREELTIAGYVWCALISAIWLLFAFIHDQKDKEAEYAPTRTANSWRAIGIIKFCRIFSVIAIVLSALMYIPEFFSEEADVLGIGLQAAKDLLFCGAYYFASCDTKPVSPKPSTKTVESTATAPETT